MSRLTPYAARRDSTTVADTFPWICQEVFDSNTLTSGFIGEVIDQKRFRHALATLPIRHSRNSDDQKRASWDEAPLEVWMDVIARYPEDKTWVVHNKTVPLPVLRLLADDDDPRIRT